MLYTTLKKIKKHRPCNATLAQNLWDNWLSHQQRDQLLRQAGYTTRKRYECYEIGTLSRAGSKGARTDWAGLSTQMQNRLVFAMSNAPWMGEEIRKSESYDRDLTRKEVK